MPSVVTVSPTVSLKDEFGDFEIREELEQELERRLRETDIDARPALKDFEPSADVLQFILRNIPYNVREQDNILENEELEKLLGVLRVKLALEQELPVKPSDAILTLKAYFRYFDQRAISRLEVFFGQSNAFLSALKNERFHTLIPKARDSQLVPCIMDVVKAPSLFKTLDILAKAFKGLRGMVGSLEDVIDGDVPLGEVYELAASFHGRVDTFVETVDSAQAGKRGQGGS